MNHIWWSFPAFKVIIKAKLFSCSLRFKPESKLIVIFNIFSVDQFKARCTVALRKEIKL